MRGHTWFALMWVVLAASLASAQTPATTPSQAPTTLSTSSTLVLVPALVRNKAGELIFNLKAGDFTLTDNGVPQRLHLEEDAGAQPLALVVDIEGGRNALRELHKFASIGPMIDSIVGDVPHRVAVVAFDSAPALVTDFSSDNTVAENGIKDLLDDNNGDGGAAILDSLGFSIDLLRRQPPQYRRAILLISETNGDSSKLKMQDAVRAVSDTNTTIYAVGFSTGKSKNEPIWSGLKSQPPTEGLSFMPEIELADMALNVAIGAMSKNVPETVAHLTGGEYFQFLSEKSLDNDLRAISNHIPNRYVLSFQPQSPRPGFHSIHLSVPGYAGLHVSARISYWAENRTAQP